MRKGHDVKPRTQNTRRRLFSAVLAVSAVSLLHGQQPSPARPRVETLASEKFGGRLAGSEGERLAAGYLIAELQKIGAKPLPGRTDFRLPFEFTAGTKDGGSRITINGNANGTVRALSF